MVLDLSLRPREDTLSQKAGWVIPKEGHLRFSSSLHEYAHILAMCTLIHMCTDIHTGKKKTVIQNESFLNKGKNKCKVVAKLSRVVRHIAVLRKCSSFMMDTNSTTHSTNKRVKTDSLKQTKHFHFVSYHISHSLKTFQFKKYYTKVKSKSTECRK